MSTPIRPRGNCVTCGKTLVIRDDGTARRHRVNEADRDWCAGSRQLPAVEPKPVLDRRAQWIADARAVLNLLESNPDLPLNLASGLTVSYHPLRFNDPDDPADAEKKAAVDAVAAQLGVPVVGPDSGHHYEAQIHFGSAAYQAVAVLRDYREKDDAIQRFGKAALAELADIEAAKAEVAAA